MRMEQFQYMKCCGRIHLSELFPSKWSGFIFIAYMAFFVNQGLLVTASQKSDNGYHYNVALAVMMAEVLKLVISFTLYIKDNSISCLVKDARVHVNMMCHYFVPAFLYCLYNNLSFVNLSMFDPTTYFLLLQLRVVVTGILFQIVFKKQLSVNQWLSLLMLTAGCMIKQLPFADYFPTTVISTLTTVQPSLSSEVTAKAIDKGVNWNMLLILVQVLCSCLAGVYNELLLKGSDSEVCNIYLQNMFMYLDSIVCNVGLLAWQGQLPVLWDRTELNHLWELKVFLVILNNAAIGIVTSFFLRSMNSILKTFASALELLFTALLTWLLFDIPIHLNTICAIFVVSLAVIMYSQNPVINARPLRDFSSKQALPV